MMSEEVSPCTIRSDLYSLDAFDGDAPLPPSSSPSSPGRRLSVLCVLSSLLNRVVARNERSSAPNAVPASLPPSPSGPSADDSKRLAVFYGIRPPTISVADYLERIFKYAHCSPSCFVVAYAYIDRLIQQHPQIRITSLNVHRILIASVLVSAKFLDDLYYDNAHYAKIGGISTQEMNKLERDFLFVLDFRLHVTVSVFESYCSHLEREVAMGGGYQVERTLRSICDPDHEAHDQQQACQSYQRRRALAVRCDGGLSS